MAYRLENVKQIQTISDSRFLSNFNIMPLASITGFLYIPGAGSCNDTDDARQFVSLPNDVNRIALIPDMGCLDDYLTQDLAIGAILYGCNQTSEASVRAGSYLQPMFSISSDEGNQLLDNIEKFSKNVSSVPNEELSAIFNPEALVRLDLTIIPALPKSSVGLRMIIGICGGVLVALIMGYVIVCKLGIRWNRWLGRKESRTVGLVTG